MRWMGAVLLIGSSALAAPHRESQQKRAEELAARGDAWMVAGRCDEAVPVYRRARELDAKSPSLQIHLAHCLARTGVHEEGQHLLEALVDAPPPTGPAALMELGELATASGDFSAAVRAYEKWVKRRPANREAQVALVEALKGLGDRGDAEAKARAVELVGKLAADAHLESGLHTRVVELEAALKYGEAGKDLLDGKAKLADGDAAAAVRALERAVAVHPDLEEAQALLGVAYANPQVARKAEARKAWKRAPHVKEAQLELGIDAYQEGRSR